MLGFARKHWKVLGKWLLLLAAWLVGFIAGLQVADERKRELKKLVSELVRMPRRLGT